MKALALVSLTLSFLGVVQADELTPGTNISVTNALTPHATSSHLNELNKGSALIGIEVLDPQKERLGTIKDLMLNLRQGRVAYTVLGTGGFLGIGDKLVALPPGALEISPEQKYLILQADKESLRAAPGLASDNWPQMTNVEWAKERSGHYALKTGEVNEAAGAENENGKKKPMGTNATADGKPAPAASIPPQKTLRASELIGTTIRNSRRERLGDIKDVALNLQSGRILYVVVSAGDFLGSNEKLFAIAPESLQGSQEPRTLILDISQQAFKKATPFNPDSWPTVPDKMFSIKATIQEPSGSPRSKESDGRTALDQSNTRRDLMITQQLRRAIMRDDTMSVLTRNITIITADGRITVRGTVASQNEVEKIVAFAREIAGNEVTNELTVQDAQESKNETIEPKKQ